MVKPRSRNMCLIFTIASVILCLQGKPVLAAPITGAAVHNSTVLQDVLLHYSNPSDSLKRAVAQFLFDNMEGHNYLTCKSAEQMGHIFD